MKNQITFLILFIVLSFSSLQAQVTQEWVARYIGRENSIFGASSLAVDKSGNVYVTGQSGPLAYQGDYATIKYNSSGVQQWVQSYNGPVGFYGPPSLVVDSSGNVYMAGCSFGIWKNPDYTTIKYNSSGVQQWIQSYNGPGNGYDAAYSLAVDNSGNVYVTGQSRGNGGSAGIATIKYNSSGIQQWIQRNTGYANSIAVDGSGNVYVTRLSFDLATIKYNSSGVQQWIQNGPGFSEDIVLLAVDSSGNVYVAGSSNGDYATIKYNSSGVQQWVQSYNGPGNLHDGATSLAVDNSGNVYVTGYSFVGGNYGNDYATIKYNSSGVRQWIQRYNGPGNYYDAATSLAVDGSGNVYVTGRSTGTGTGSDYATIKYNSSGIQQWVQRYNGDGANSIAVDGSGNVYVTGGSDGDFVTIKYSQTVAITAPSELNAQSVDSSFIKVTWRDNSNDEDGFYIERTQINDSSHWEVIDAVPQNVNEYSDYFVTRGLKYYYRVKAYSGNIHSGYSNIDSAVLGGDPSIIPASPSELALIKRTESTIKIGWLDNSANENGFIIARKKEKDLFFKIIDSVGTDVVTYQEIGVSPDQVYFYKVCSFNDNGISDFSNTISVSTARISKTIFKDSGYGDKYILSENFPNPFNPMTKIRFEIPQDARSETQDVKLIILDVLGREVATLVNETLIAGSYEVEFDGSYFSSGVYFYRLQAGDFFQTKRMVLLK